MFLAFSLRSTWDGAWVTLQSRHGMLKFTSASSSQSRSCRGAKSPMLRPAAMQPGSTSVLILSFIPEGSALCWDSNITVAASRTCLWLWRVQ